MSRLKSTLETLAPGVTRSRDIPGFYNPRRGLAIYFQPIPDYSPSGPGLVLGEALAARSGLGCTLLDGIPAKIPEGAVVVGQYAALKAIRPDLLEFIPEMKEQEYAIKLAHSGLVVAPSREGLACGMQTLSMLLLRFQGSRVPGVVVSDGPLRQTRGLAVEIRTPEIGINLLMQMASFAATFKANRLHLILDEEFDPGRVIPGHEAFIQACQSYGISVGVRLPWLRPLLAGERNLHDTWSGIRAAARAFGATQAAFDDHCPPGASSEQARQVMDSIANGEVGISSFSVDEQLIDRSGIPRYQLKSLGLSAWHRLDRNASTLPSDDDSTRLVVDVEAPLPGFSSADLDGYHQRLDQACLWLGPRARQDMLISFRNIGISHMWQNLMLPAATGLIAAWGRPHRAQDCADSFASLLYGEAADTVQQIWRTAGMAFPAGLNVEEERLLRQTAFGRWPDKRTTALLETIDWQESVTNIRKAAEYLKEASASLSRNASTLTGAKLSLHALSWLHCFAALVPELERRRKLHYDDDGRTEPIADELFANFKVWHDHLETLQQESGLEIGEMPLIESMGLRLQGIWEGIFE